MAIIRIHDLNVRTIIGAHSWERTNKQDLVINIVVEYDASKASATDKLKDALDYETIADNIVRITERSRYLLLEKLAAVLIKSIMTDKRVIKATVRLDKPHAVAQAKCVSFELSAPK